MKPDQEFVETAQHFSEEAVSLYGKSRTGLLLYRVIVILSGPFFIGLILWDGFGNTGKDSHQMMLLLTFLTLALGLLLFHTGMEYGRMYRAIARSPRVLYDYCARWNARLKKPRQKTTRLFLMAKCAILEGRLAEAGNALNSLDYYSIPVENQAAYHLLWAVIDRLDGKEEDFSHNVEVYRQMLASAGRKIPRGEQRLQTLRGGSEEQIRQLADVREDLWMSKRNLLRVGRLLLTISLLCLFFLGEGLLPQGMEYRTWFTVWGCIFLEVAVVIFAILFISSQDQLNRSVGRRRGLFLGAFIAVLVVGLFFFAVWDLQGLFYLKSEEKLADGNLLVREDHFLDPVTYSVYEPTGLIFSRYLYTSDEDGNRLTYSWSTDAGDSSSETDSYDSSGGWGATDQEKRELYENIYDTQLAAEYPGGLEMSYSAKGELYAYAGDSYSTQFQGNAVTARIRLVYDRESENGACYEVVRYEDHYDADGNRLDNTSIQDIYAVVKSTGEVIPSGRTGWADVGNEEYRRATGE